MTEKPVQIALVSGASRGIGKAIAEHLGQAGNQVIGTATSVEGANHITETLQRQKIAGQGMVLDVADPDSIARLKDDLQRQDMIPNVLVNNAGITRDNLMLRMSAEDWENVLVTNLHAVYYLCKAFLKEMLKARNGRIINISSVVALSGNAGQTNYTAAKAGMIGLTRSLAQELAPRGITVNAIAPGFIATDMVDTLTEKQSNTVLEKIPLQRFGTADDIAATVAFLASNQAAYITGETINVSGGLYMG